MSQSIPEEVRRLMRPSAAALEPYDPAFSEVRVNLSANENTYGMPADVAANVEGALVRTATNRYPAPLADELRRELAAWHGVSPERVIVGNGGDELLFNLVLAFGGAGHVLVSAPPTFSVYRLYAELVETEVQDVPRDSETFAPDVDALLEAARTASLVVVTSPNNPTGDLFPLEATRRLCAACPGVVLIDEAYIEFAHAGASAKALLAECGNLVVLHTLSKAFCLAGARIGYLVGPSSVMAALAAVRQPYSVNVLSQAAALAVVRGRASFEPVIEKIKAERARLLEGCRARADRRVRAWPSEANFVLVRVPRAHEVRERLRDEHSILVRDFSSAPGLKDCLRITVGTPDENDAVLDALAQLTREERAQ
ncbi:MAG: histidinol-phosphate transaminase [Olsenella sp.]|nr:histidinol-phosphate transaminase [Olsenella sp.]